MRILILSLPFMGMDKLGKAIARDKGYEFIADPMNLDYYGTFTRYYYHDGNSMVYKEGGVIRPYIFGEDVPDGTIMTHYVGANKLPKNLDENGFIDQLSVQFDRVVAFKSNNLETHWKRWCAAVQSYKVNNNFKNHFLKLNAAHLTYQDSDYNQELVDKIINGHDALEAYVNRSGISSIVIQDIQRQTPTEEAIEVDVITNELAKLNISIGSVGEVDAEGNVTNERIWSALRGDNVNQY